MAARRPSARRGFGQVRQLQSGMWQARYSGPDLLRHVGPTTFQTKGDAEEWLIDERRLIQRAAIDPTVTWRPPKERKAAVKAERDAEAARLANSTFGVYARSWVAERKLKPRTKATYEKILERFLLPKFGEMPLEAISKAVVREWYSKTAVDTPTQRAHAYGLLRTILHGAVREDLIAVNPAMIEGAGSAKSDRDVEPATLAELEVMAEAMQPERRAMLLLAAWCALRFGEVTELRRSDVDLESGLIQVRRAVVRVNGKCIIGVPKSKAGRRDVNIPPHILPAIKAHLDTHVDRFDQDALLFPADNGGHLAPSTLYGRPTTFNPDETVKRPGEGWYHARQVAGREDLRWHDLRHAGAVMAAQAGATLAELMARLGHSTVQASLVYQHAASGRDRILADRLSEMATATA